MAFVFVGGIVGTLIRYGVERGLPAGPGDWPWATFAVNCVGTLILGALIAGLTAIGADTGWRLRTRLLLGVGFCGSLTTYSAFALESDRLLAGGDVGVGLGYVVGTVVAGLVCATVGFVVGRGLGDQVGAR
ncbi:putative fluoride ion transporter CrcB 2 [Williamsia phyllosphaerae]|uniref:Fluoride-specific ion channel FluC n=2 Tax=Williamsia phyllosphaerae TaxID=885042 RepID=A0ABQ1UJ90_9NOCA|nr:putative fluoride ion transporter CrcB 2 [Williamsia phyllosphaerae]